MTDAIYILNTKSLKDDGFEGSLNDLADEIADKGGVVSGSYEETGEPVMTIYGIEEDDLVELLDKHGVENPEKFVNSVEDDDVDYDKDLDDNGDIESHVEPEGEPSGEPDHVDDNDDIPDPSDDDDDFDITFDDDDDDDSLEHAEEDHHEHDDEHEDHHEEDTDDDHDTNDDDVDDDNFDDDINDDDDIDVNIDVNIDYDDNLDHDDNIDHDDYIDDDDDACVEESKKHKKIRGTQNLSESVTRSILQQVKDSYILKRIQDRAEVLDKLNEASKNVVINMNPWSNVKVNGTPIWKYRNMDIIDLIAESQNGYKELYKKYKILNESHAKRKDFVSALKKQKKLIEILESEALFRRIKKDKLNEDDAAAAAVATDDSASTEPSTDNTQDTQEATLTSIVFKVKNADEFIKVLTDNGIPAEALKKGNTDDVDNDDNAQDDQQNADNQAAAPAPDAAAGGAPAPAAPAPSANPFESLTVPLTKKNKLNEAGNPFDEIADEGTDPATTGDPDQPGPIDGVDPLNADEAQSAGEGEEVILTDTSYASKVQQILADVYGYDKKQFEDKIGGELVDEDGSDEDSDNVFNNLDDNDGSDDGSDDGNDEYEDDEKIGQEDSISPEDIFKDLPGGL